MNAAKKKPTEDLRLSSAEFDRIMGRALQVKPEAAKAKSGKKKSGSKKTGARRK